MTDELLSTIIGTLCQYEADLRRPPEGDSVGRRLARVNEVIEMAEAEEARRANEAA